MTNSVLSSQNKFTADSTTLYVITIRYKPYQEEKAFDFIHKATQKSPSLNPSLKPKLELEKSPSRKRYTSKEATMTTVTGTLVSMKSMVQDEANRSRPFRLPCQLRIENK